MSLPDMAGALSMKQLLALNGLAIAASLVLFLVPYAWKYWVVWPWSLLCVLAVLGWRKWARDKKMHEGG